eukprot:TRINITY_DN96127_c0_g1_i1.p1 TRINITY_DN96127_c0_g1~~TRINITY_DN96127_c0_g1_i1.p1  ORF type:complete len:345 (-),score=42.09 TRINITY_DN96127_c0_g1_i1:66-1100(-)
MHFGTLLTFCLLVATAASGAPSNPFYPGPYKVKSLQIGNILVPHYKAGLSITVKYPDQLNEKVPVHVFMTAFYGIVPAEFYKDFLDRVASHGYIVIGSDKLEIPDYPRMAHAFNELLAWLPKNLQKHIKKHRQPVIPDFDKLTVGSHSSAGHVVTLALSYQCGPVKAQVMIDPVDGLFPWGNGKKHVVIHPGHYVNYTTPIMHMECGLDNHHLPFFPACAPNLLSNNRFYNAMPGPKWQVNATNFGHGGFLNPGWEKMSNILCVENKTANHAAYRSQVAGLLVSFLRVVSGDLLQQQYLTNTTLMPTHSLARHNLDGYEPQPTFWGFCKHAAPASAAAQEDDAT